MYEIITTMCDGTRDINYRSSMKRAREIANAGRFNADVAYVEVFLMSRKLILTTFGGSEYE